MKIIYSLEYTGDKVDNIIFGIIDINAQPHDEGYECKNGWTVTFNDDEYLDVDLDCKVISLPLEGDDVDECILSGTPRDVVEIHEALRLFAMYSNYLVEGKSFPVANSPEIFVL